MRTAIVVILMTLLSSAESWCQTSGQSLVITRAVVVDGDTIPHIRLGEVRCWGHVRFRSKRAREKYTRLVHNVRKALPYARIAAQRINEIEDSLSKLPTKKLKEEFIKESEKKLFAEFEKPLKHLTISQGRILIKLIDRETGNTSYQLIKTLKGSFSAFLWQGVARLFGSSLKSEYDAEGEDKAIEYIVNAIDNGAYDDIIL